MLIWDCQPSKSSMSVRAKTLLSVALWACAPATLAEGFSPGERIDLSIDYLGIHTGKAQITVGTPEGSIWPVVALARTEGVAKVIDIREHLVSYWDAETRLPRGSDLSAMEIGDRHVDSARFDRERGKATVRVLRKGRNSEDIYDVPRDVHDIASALLWLRLQPLEDGGHYQVPVLGGRRVFTLLADVVGREPISTEAGAFDAVKVQVRTAFDGKFSTKRDTFIWFSADSRHVPVRLSAEFAVGSLVVSLTGYRPGEQLAQR